ncbi:Glycoside hydrolase, 38 vacuolar alpha mannosidase [Coemansia javaensis]|uniref:Alpha-mannosidase n=1 Tax=Coemansia javaensis TaxID=2761396 RepID=A0A9W8H5U8_9FUNG|nr:Glycoside hydrolase, 38 vacuolar alpha mannosidase [Coemansia javaensis]
MDRHMSYLQKHPSITRSRVNNFIGGGQWSDVNVQTALYDLRVSGEPHIRLEVWSAPGQERPTFGHAVRQKFRPAKVGQMFGPSWTTHWFRVHVQIPAQFAGKPVQFLFDSNSEAMVWSPSGEPIMGLTGGGGGERHVDYALTPCAAADEAPRLFFVEVACNGLFGNGNFTQRPQDRDIYYRLSSVELAAPNPAGWALLHDLEVVVEMAGRLPQESPRSWQALAAANGAVNAFERSDPATVEAARGITQEFLSVPGNPAGHQVYAIGNCHIDTAWLWPFAETRRKTARSWSTQLTLMESYPEYRFTASQAQQFEWLLHDYPSLFARIQDKAKAGQFIPIGGTWVEMDCNIPSGESLARQFLLGQRFFKKHFGQTCDVFWLPDTFGYSSQLPQIVRLAGARYFFTQKLSWNNINRFPHTTFRWIGLDGSHILTHMAPSETYGAQCRPGELIDSLGRHKDLAYTNESLFLFGNGDGGGGPLRPMLERLRRMANTDGLPRVKQAHPREFYRHVEDNSKQLVSWKGELYFELHRGTYTSQSNNKLWNRRAEFLLRDAEMLATVAAMGHGGRGGFVYPADELARLWKLVCLNQFHDVVPGSSITMVYRDSAEMYADIFESATAIRDRALSSIYGPPAPHGAGLSVLNTTGWVRSDIVAIPPAEYSRLETGSDLVQVRASDGAILVPAINVPGFCAQPIDARIRAAPLEVGAVSVVASADGSHVLENRFVRVAVNAKGQIESYYDKDARRELVPKGAAANVFELYDDVPVFWDAWDIEIYATEKYRQLDGAEVSVADRGPLVASLSVRVPISDGSVLTQTISLSGISPRLDFDCDVDWHENRKCLKVSFTWDIHSDVATYETQYGALQRPTHRNTSWDMAKFEVCAHKFADLSEFGYGVALLNDCKYGHATLGNTMSLSLLRAPKAPDEHCDMGRHQFRYAIYPHAGTFSESNVVQEAYQFNVPLVQLSAHDVTGAVAGASRPFFSVTGARNVVLDTVKLAEDDGASYIVRMYEAYGGHARAILTSRLPAADVCKVNILEEPMDGARSNEDMGIRWLDHSRSLEVQFKPFEVISLRFSA